MPHSKSTAFASPNLPKADIPTQFHAKYPNSEQCFRSAWLCFVCSWLCVGKTAKAVENWINSVIADGRCSSAVTCATAMFFGRLATLRRTPTAKLPFARLLSKEKLFTEMRAKWWQFVDRNNGTYVSRNNVKCVAGQVLDSIFSAISLARAKSIRRAHGNERIAGIHRWINCLECEWA